MSKHSSAKYYKDNEERIQCKALRDIKYLPENGKQKLVAYRKKIL